MEYIYIYIYICEYYVDVRDFGEVQLLKKKQKNSNIIQGIENKMTKGEQVKL